jgi:hypothetical protein
MFNFRSLFVLYFTCSRLICFALFMLVVTANYNYVDDG